MGEQADQLLLEARVARELDGDEALARKKAEEALAAIEDQPGAKRHARKSRRFLRGDG